MNISFKNIASAAAVAILGTTAVAEELRIGTASLGGAFYFILYIYNKRYAFIQSILATCTPARKVFDYVGQCFSTFRLPD